MIQRILVGYDDGTHSQKALDTAIEIARNTKGEIFIVSVLDIPLIITSPDMLPSDNITVTKFYYDSSSQYFKRIQEQAAARVQAHGLAATVKVMEGSPGKTLIKYAEEVKADIIAVGSNNKGVLDRFFLGSVSNYVIQHAKCMVLVAKD